MIIQRGRRSVERVSPHLANLPNIENALIVGSVITFRGDLIRIRPFPLG